MLTASRRWAQAWHILRPGLAAGHRRVGQIRRRAWRFCLFDRRVHAARRGRRHVLAIGDSHLKVFDVARHSLLDVALVDINIVDGATAMGIVNPNSHTDALRIFRGRLDAAKPWQTLLCLLGEVDCGFVIWYRSERENISVAQQLDISLDNYLDFVDWARGRFLEVWIMSAPLPTIPDGVAYGDVAQKRSQVTASLQARTQLTLLYNSRLKEECARRGLRFLDVTEAQRDETTGLVRENLLNSDRLDHHLDSERFADLVERTIRDALNGDDRDGPG